MAGGGLYGGLAEGLQSGLRIGGDLAQQRQQADRYAKQDEREAKREQRLQEQQDFENRLHTAAEKRSENAERTAQAKAALEANRAKREQLVSQAGTAAQSGQQDPNIALQLQQLEDEAEDQYVQLAGPTYAAHHSQARREIAALQSGELSLDELLADPVRGYNDFSYVLGQPLETFRDMPGKPSEIGKAAAEAEGHMKAGDFQGAFRAGRPLLGAEMGVGVGQRTKDGARITEKRPVAAFPHPQNPAYVMIGVDVDVDHPEKGAGSYHAPMTPGRGVDDETVASIPIKKLFERLGSAKAFHAFLNSEEGAPMRDMIDKALAAGAGQEYRDMLKVFNRHGGDINKLHDQLERQTTNLGGRSVTRTYEKATGKMVDEKYDEHTPVPRAAGTGLSSTDKRVASIDAAEDSGELTPEEAESARKRALGVPRADKPPRETLTLSEAMATVRGLKDKHGIEPLYNTEDAILSAAKELQKRANAEGEKPNGGLPPPADPPPALLDPKTQPAAGGPDTLSLMQQGGLPSAQPTKPAPQAIPAPKDREVGRVYDTPKGQLTWTGTGWTPVK
jgi:hypothetical protein